MSQPHQQHQQPQQSYPSPATSRPIPQPQSSRRRIPPSANPLLRRPGPPNRITSAPPGPTGNRLRDVSLASLLEGVDQVPSARKRLLPSAAGVVATGASRPGVMQAKIPQRTTKTSQKEVLLPENASAIEDSSSSSDEDDVAVQAQPISPTRTHSPTRTTPPKKPPPAKPRKSFAERLAKSQRDESMLPRVTAYCTCEAYKLLATQKFLTEQHAVKGAVIYDEALYARYELPLRNGEGGFRIKSGELKKQDDSSREYSSDPETQNKTNHTNGSNIEEHSVGSSAMLDGQIDDDNLLFSPPKPTHEGPPRGGVHFLDEEDQKAQRPIEEPSDRQFKRRDSTPVDVNALSNLAEIFVFSYGVVVFWNFTERQERDILADLTFASNSPPPSREGLRPTASHKVPTGPLTRILSPRETTPLLSDMHDDTLHATHSPTTQYGAFEDIPIDKAPEGARPATGLMVRVLKEMDVQIEDFHFEYNPRTRSPRIRDDMITLRTPSAKIKLAISHAIAQSVKLSVFEDAMENTMTSSKFLPAELARRGELGLTRREVVRMSGRLFRLRVGIMLGGTVLDTPDWFWESEPELHELYSAVREYLELTSRVQVLNDRSEVLFDLLDILSDSIAESNMGRITWIIIALILLSVLVTSLEVIFRVEILRRHGGEKC